MSDAATATTDDYEVCCEYCGFPIEKDGQRCYARDAGVCEP